MILRACVMVFFFFFAAGGWTVRDEPRPFSPGAFLRSPPTSSPPAGQGALGVPSRPPRQPFREREGPSTRSIPQEPQLLEAAYEGC